MTINSIPQILILTIRTIKQLSSLANIIKFIFVVKNNIFVTMRTKKQQQSQQPFILTTNPSQPINDPHKMLNDMYQRIKSKTNQDKRQATTDSNIVLLSYLSKSHQESNQNNQTIQKLKDSLERAHLQTNSQIDAFKLKKQKKYSQKERIKTQFDQLDSVSEVEYLRRENQMLKNKLNKCEKRVIYLEPFEGEVEYLKKLVFIQDTQIEKLRLAVKNAKRAQLQNCQQQNRITQCASMGLKQVKCRNEPILISDESTSIQNANHLPKKKKCSHKLKPQPPCQQHTKTQSRIQVTSNSKNRSFHSKQREQQNKKLKKQKNICR